MSGDPVIASIDMFGGNFAPRGWAFCNGQLLAISANTALFSILGTTYGGDGRTTFGLPNLQSRVPMHAGQGAGLSTRTLGELGGTETVTLLTPNLPSHAHTATHGGIIKFRIGDDPADSFATIGRAIGQGAAALTDGQRPKIMDESPKFTENNYFDDNVIDSSGLTINVGNTGGNMPFNNLQPFLVVNFCICLFGIFPSRN